MESISTVCYVKKTGNKSRLITTYAKNKDGRKLRIWHSVKMIFIENYLFPNELCFAYTKNKSAKLMVQKHLNSNHFLYVDIKSFFNNIDLDILKGKSKFLETKNMSFAEICKLIDSCKIKEEEGIAIGLIPSAFFSNVYLRDFDEYMDSYLQNLNKNFKYSRYSDDIVISCSEKFDFMMIQNEISAELSKIKLCIHDSKTRVKTLEKKGDHIKILGLNIVKGENSNYITVSRKFKKDTWKSRSILSRKGRINYIKYSES